LSAYLDGSKASKLAAKLDEIVDEFEEVNNPKKRKNGDDAPEQTKRPKFEEGIKENVDQKPASLASSDSRDGSSTAEAPSPVLTNDSIREMMANAQRAIEERKRLLEAQGVLPQMGVGGGPVGGPIRVPTPGNPFVARQPRSMGPGFGGEIQRSSQTHRL
jgi:hypothetical protein